IVTACLNHILLLSHDCPPTEIYTLSLHDALPIYGEGLRRRPHRALRDDQEALGLREAQEAREAVSGRWSTVSGRLAFGEPPFFRLAARTATSEARRAP